MTVAALKAETLHIRQQPLKVVVAGHVDHGKSTLIGRLIYECQALPEAKLLEIKKATERRNVDFEWAFLLDALQSERDQNITIDSTRLWLRRARRDLILIDVPGHVQFLRNMITGCSEADLGVLIVDAASGMEEQTMRHALLMRLLGLRHVIVVFNKMDKIDFNEAAFESLKNKVRFTLGDLGLDVFAAIPVSAKQGDNLSTLSSRMPWFTGPTLMGLLDTYEREEEQNAARLRFMVQDVLRKNSGRLYLGRVLNGKIAVGDEINILPAGRRARVKALYQNDLDRPISEANVGQSIGVTLDYPLFIDRGSVFACDSAPPNVTQAPQAHVFWLDNSNVAAGHKFVLRMKSVSLPVTLQETGPSTIHGELSHVKMLSAVPITYDGPGGSPALGSFLLQDGPLIRAIGWFDHPSTGEGPSRTTPKSTNITWAQHKIDATRRAVKQGHRGITVWLTGLPASGKSTLAMEIEHRLFERGWRVYVLDGDNMRQGLNSDLGFEAKDRHEGIRRAGETAALFADAGIIALVAMVSPFAADRQALRAKNGDTFYEVYVNASSDACAQRDPKKLYEKARKGEIKGFTGVDAPYQAPENPDLMINTETMSVAEAADLLEENILMWARVAS